MNAPPYPVWTDPKMRGCEYVDQKGWCIDGKPIRLRCRKCGLVEEPGVAWSEGVPIERDEEGHLRFGQGILGCPRVGCDSTDIEVGVVDA